MSARIPDGIPIAVWLTLMTAYIIGIISSSITNYDDFSKKNEKLNTLKLKITEIIKRRANGLLLLTIVPIFEKIVAVFERTLFMATSFTNNIKIRTAIAPGIRDTKNIPLISII